MLMVLIWLNLSIPRLTFLFQGFKSAYHIGGRMDKCILFDCDGTLVDSERLASTALCQLFKDIDIVLDIEVVLVRFRGCKLLNTIDAICSENKVLVPNDFLFNYRFLLANLFEHSLQSMHGIRRSLDILTQTKAVVSNGPRSKINQALRVCGLAHYFTGNIYSAYDIGFWKPDPEIYLHAVQDMGYEISDCVVVDDSLVGIKSGVSAGIKTLFYNRYNEPYDMKEAISFSSMSDLPKLIHS